MFFSLVFFILFLQTSNVLLQDHKHQGGLNTNCGLSKRICVESIDVDHCEAIVTAAQDIEELAQRDKEEEGIEAEKKKAEKAAETENEA